MAIVAEPETARDTANTAAAHLSPVARLLERVRWLARLIHAALTNPFPR